MLRTALFLCSILALAGFVALVTFDPAFAIGGTPSPGPAPLIGVGLPIVGGVLAAVLLVVWRLRQKGGA
jgi:hypothetical protein